MLQKSGRKHQLRWRRSCFFFNLSHVFNQFHRHSQLITAGDFPSQETPLHPVLPSPRLSFIQSLHCRFPVLTELLHQLLGEAAGSYRRWKDSQKSGSFSVLQTYRDDRGFYRLLCQIVFHFLAKAIGFGEVDIHSKVDEFAEFAHDLCCILLTASGTSFSDHRNDPMLNSPFLRILSSNLTSAKWRKHRHTPFPPSPIPSNDAGTRDYRIRGLYWRGGLVQRTQQPTVGNHATGKHIVFFQWRFGVGKAPCRKLDAQNRSGLEWSPQKLGPNSDARKIKVLSADKIVKNSSPMASAIMASFCFKISSQLLHSIFSACLEGHDETSSVSVM